MIIPIKEGILEYYLTYVESDFTCNPGPTICFTRVKYIILKNYVQIADNRIQHLTEVNTLCHNFNLFTDEYNKKGTDPIKILQRKFYAMHF